MITKSQKHLSSGAGLQQGFKTISSRTRQRSFSANTKMGSKNAQICAVRSLYY